MLTQEPVPLQHGHVLVADIEKVVFGRLIGEAEEDTEGTFITLVASTGGLVLQASSGAERDEWARAFLLLLRYVTKLTLKTLKAVTKVIPPSSLSDSKCD